MEQESLSFACDLMTDFADRTGLLSPGRTPRRYLWTDAFAVCNFLELYRQTSDVKYRELASRLVDQVHWVLGHHRSDDPRTGWISGLGEEEGAQRPTAAGLRIGKPLNERSPDEPFDEESEWDRDGQYYHYLTKWMHALCRMGQMTEDRKYVALATELARIAHARFFHGPSSNSKRLYWKMSIDLSRPLVSATGQHDPLDGLVTFSELQASAQKADEPGLDKEISDLSEISNFRSLATADSLGIGGLLFDACRVMQLVRAEAFPRQELLRTILASAQAGLEAFVVRSPERLPSSYRLAFRELGLAIGLRGVPLMNRLFIDHPQVFESSLWLHIEFLTQHVALAERLEQFWADPENRRSESWTAHEDINAVMLATSLLPGGFFNL